MSETRVLLGIIGLMSISIIALMGYVIYSETKSTDEQKTPKYVDTRKDVIFYYGDFFKTPQQQKRIETVFFNDKSNTHPVTASNTTDPIKYNYVCRNRTVTTTTTPAQFTTTQIPFKPRNRTLGEVTNSSAPFERLERRKRETFYIEPEKYHACCTSHRHFVSPPEVVSDHDNSVLTLTHYNGQRQYFLSETCVHGEFCTMDCACQQQVGLHRALVHNPVFTQAMQGHIPRYVVRTVRLPGGCKCMNGELPPWLD